MRAVGIKNLKAKLSEYLRLVKAGETVLITERDEVIAEIKPTNRQSILASLDEFLEQAQEDGLVCLRSVEKISWPKRPKIDWFCKPVSKKILDSLRDE